MHTAFFDAVNEHNPWYPIQSLVEAFNDNRRKWLVASLVIVLDESMSNFQPRTTKTSLLPHLSFIFRKPKPLGTEYKVAADGEVRVVGYIEIQKGAAAMRSEPYFINGIGSTAACSVRGLVAMAHSGQATADRQLAQQQEKRHLLIADSWFGGVRMVEAIKLLRPKQNDDGTTEYIIDRDAGENPNAHEVIAAVKTNSGWFPKEEIEKKMEEWPSGSYLVLECTAPETNVQLVAIGYKYNARKALCFIMTKEAAATKPGAKPYIARFPDQFGNVCSRKVPRPEAVSLYFSHNNVIDVHNHLRQHLLGLERHWKTPNPWLRNAMSIVGITTIDAYQSIRYHCPHLLDMTVEEFADHLAHDCVTNRYTSDGTMATRGYLPADALDAASQPSRSHAMPSVLLHQVNHMTQQLNDIVLNTCRGGGPSPLSSVGSASSGSTFFFGPPSHSVNTPSDHDTIAIRKKDESGRSVKRRCVVCKKDTHSECSHPRCMARKKTINNNKGQSLVVFGTPVCTLTCGARPGHRLTCLATHRRDFATVEHSERGFGLAPFGS